MLIQPRAIKSAVAVLAILIGSSVSHAALTGPAFPPPGGTFSYSGSGDSGLAGGRTWTYTVGTPADFSALYWGPWNTANAVASGLEGILNSMTLSGFSGTAATWTGSSSYSHFNGVWITGTFPTRFTANVSGLGSSPWVTGSSVGRSDVPALVNATGASGFSANILFEVYYGNSWIPIKNLANDGGQTITSFSGGFYYEPTPVPEPSTIVAGALLAVPLSVVTFRRLRNQPSESAA